MIIRRRAQIYAGQRTGRCQCESTNDTDKNIDVVSPLTKVGCDNKSAPWQITLSAMAACLSFILMAVEVIAENESHNQSSLSRIASELALDNIQAAEVDRILAEIVDLRALAMESSKGASQEELRMALKSITENADNQLRSFLSDKQFTRYVALRTEVRREVLRHRVKVT